MQQPTRSAPVAERERIDALDVLRGFALLGILLSNLKIFAQPVTDAFEYAASGRLSDLLVGGVIVFFAQGKFYPLFSLLFGLGFALQLQRAEARGASVRPLYARRLGILAGIGVLHGTFIWAGDILAVYALLGLLLLPLAGAGERTLRNLALALYLVQVAVIVALAWLLSNPAVVPGLSSLAVETLRAADVGDAVVSEQAWAAYTTGDYAAVTAARWREFCSTFAGLPFWGLQILAMFLFGAWLGRRNVFADPAAHTGFFRAALRVGVLLGLPLAAAYVVVDLPRAPGDIANAGHGVRSLLNLFGGPMLMLMYVALIVRALRRPGAGWLQHLAPLGRMALSNYLLQSLVMTTIFYGYGLGAMADAPGALFMAGVALALFPVQLLASHAWLRYFRFGPVEWLWRSLTYLRWQPLRRAPPMATARLEPRD